MILQQKDATIRVTETGEVFPLKYSPTTIGRSDDNDIVLDEAAVSRRHAELWNDNGAWFIQDLDTPNGIEVNSFVLQRGERYPLGLRSRIIVASSCELIFEAADDKPDMGQTQVLSSNLMTPPGRTGDLGSMGYDSGSTTVLNEVVYPTVPVQPETKKSEGRASGGKKKSKRPIVLVLTLLVLLAAAGGAFYMTEGFKSASVRQLQQDIQNIGEVTLSSGEQIRSARAAFEALSEKDVVRVSNAALLTQAEEQYEVLLNKQAAEQYDEKVKAVGTVTLDSEAALISLRAELDGMDAQVRSYVTTEEELTQRETELQHVKDQSAAERLDKMIVQIGEVTLESEKAIEQARAEYDQAEPAVKALVKKLPQLEEAEATWHALKAESDYAEIAELLRTKDWEPLREKTLAFLKDFGDSANAPDAEKAYVECCLQLSKQYENAKRYEAAEALLIEGRDLALEADNGKIQTALDRLQTVIRNMRPQNGAVLAGNCRGGYCQIIVDNGTKDTLIKLENNENPEYQYLLFYVRAGETVKMNIKDGNYTLKYATGETWYGLDARFGENTAYNKADSPFAFETTYQNGYVNYIQQEITLYAVEDGNISTSYITGDEF